MVDSTHFGIAASRNELPTSQRFLKIIINYPEKRISAE